MLDAVGITDDVMKKGFALGSDRAPSLFIDACVFGHKKHKSNSAIQNISMCHSAFYLTV